MPPSQLKRLKASLREKGIVGPQKSKKQKKELQRNGGGDRAERQAALAALREDFNPFDVKTLARPKKFEATTLKRGKDKNAKVVLGRPDVTKSAGEETRRQALLPELNRRNKVGGIMDRRFGENDPTMAPEERMQERFVKEMQRKKGSSMFDLEEADDDEGALTHGGKALAFSRDEPIHDDFDAGSLAGSSDDDGDFLSRKRRRDSDEDEGYDALVEDAQQPERKKSKAEVMKEVIAKSKMHKYERQQAKEDDDDERAQLDGEFSDILAVMQGHKVPQRSAPAPETDENINAERAALIKSAEKQYDTKVKELARDARAQPTDRTKTAEEEAAETAARLREQEMSRQRRMRGEQLPDDEQDEEEHSDKTPNDLLPGPEDEEELIDDAAAFNLSRKQTTRRPEGVEDEDDFLLDDDLIASGSDLGSDVDVSEDESESADEKPDYPEDEEAEFVRGFRPNDASTAPVQFTGANQTTELAPVNTKLAYTYPCPESHKQLLEVFKGVASTDVPTVIQRIRALYHPQLSAANNEKLAKFAVALVGHVAYMLEQRPAAPLNVVETIIRHLHSLSRSFAEEIAEAFRSHLEAMQSKESPTSGDLGLLTAIGTIYPTSDHFHQIATPAITIMAKWMGLSTPTSNQDLKSMAYVCALALQYQQLSKRYVPEVVRYSCKALETKCITPELITTYTTILTKAADLWSTKSAFTEIFAPRVLTLLKRHSQKHAVQRLKILLSQARLARRPLELHHHRPIPIKTQIPKFEESFNPDKRYDPDRDKAEASKLKAEYKKERKGALRELRKDANFIARTKLREKKEADAAYETKFKKIIANIQSEEGKEANEYERIKRARKSKR